MSFNGVAVCITCGGQRQQIAAAHFAERDLDVRWFLAPDCQAIGVSTSRAMPNDMDPDHQGTIGPRPTGIWIAHRALWAALDMLAWDVPVMILEDDAEFAADWRERLNDAAAYLPPNWDVLYPGSCCTGGHKTRIGGELWQVTPMTTHCYIPRRQALARMIETSDAAGICEPIDASLARHTYPGIVETTGRRRPDKVRQDPMQVFAVLPRLVGQRGTVLLP